MIHMENASLVPIGESVKKAYGNVGIIVEYKFIFVYKISGNSGY